jgi:hypothetical protein
LLLIEQHFGRRIPIEDIDLDDLRSLGRLARLLRAPPADLRAVGRSGASRRG